MIEKIKECYDSIIGKRKPELTAQELAQALVESFRDQKDIDWALTVIHKNETAEDGQWFQQIRAELFRLGVKHSAQQ